jgi:hypothetical protein
MKIFTKRHLFIFSIELVILIAMLMSSCTSPQHFSFSPAPPAYQKTKKEIAAPALPETESKILTASAANEPVVLPELAPVAAAKAQTLEKTTILAVQKNQGATKQKLTLAQKVVLKKLQKQATKLERKAQQTKDIAEGPVSNRNAIGLILIGLIVALLGAILGGIFTTLGTLIILIGLVLLILNYI